jgi:hypothetical protein
MTVNVVVARHFFIPTYPAIPVPLVKLIQGTGKASADCRRTAALIRVVCAEHSFTSAVFCIVSVTYAVVPYIENDIIHASSGAGWTFPVP